MIRPVKGNFLSMMPPDSVIRFAPCRTEANAVQRGWRNRTCEATGRDDAPACRIFESSTTEIDAGVWDSGTGPRDAVPDTTRRFTRWTTGANSNYREREPKALSLSYRIGAHECSHCSRERHQSRVTGQRSFLLLVRGVGILVTP